MNDRKSKTAVVDYDKWARRAYWTLDEAKDLFLGVEPFVKAEMTLGEKLEEMQTPAALQLELYRQKLESFGINDIGSLLKSGYVLYEDMKRAVEAGTLKTIGSDSTKVTPSDFIQWVQDSNRSLSAELTFAVNSASSNEVEFSNEKNLKKNQEDNYLRFILGVAIQFDGYDPKAARNKMTGGNSGSFSDLCNLNQRTVSRILNKAIERVGAEFGLSK